MYPETLTCDVRGPGVEKQTNFLGSRPYKPQALSPELRKRGVETVPAGSRPSVALIQGY